MFLGRENFNKFFPHKSKYCVVPPVLLFPSVEIGFLPVIKAMIADRALKSFWLLVLWNMLSSPLC
jgi:hypothetical protein